MSVSWIFQVEKNRQGDAEKGCLQAVSTTRLPFTFPKRQGMFGSAPRSSSILMTVKYDLSLFSLVKNRMLRVLTETVVYRAVHPSPLTPFTSAPRSRRAVTTSSSHSSRHSRHSASRGHGASPGPWLSSSRMNRWARRGPAWTIALSHTFFVISPLRLCSRTR